MSINHISVVIMAKNAEETIDRSLASLGAFPEVILYLNDSTDMTETIASAYDNVKIVKGKFIGFGKTKNSATEYSRNDWILSLDSDEVLNEKLVNEIQSLDTENIKKIYRLKRDNYFLGHQTQSQDTITRLYNKKFTKFNDNAVHEKILHPKGAILHTLKQSFVHLNITNINQTLTKIIQYTDLGSENKKTCFFLIVIAKSLFAFFKTYIIQGNIIKGWVGFALAINSANKRYYKYLKQYIYCQNEKTNSLDR
ncbi:MAG: glycosyltransferase family 2 protein [Campylobacterota bacterium]|nr:glycosyltransferase family 2 protein [Campylobacterota bacterium]